MLSTETIQIIKSTVPVLETHGETITKRFYNLLFSKNPELLNVFNHANQRQGRQQQALANAVYAAAAHIDELDKILPVVKQIGHKHRSLGITAEQYPIVGENLLLAIKDVLGDAATDEIINAWKEAYDVIASVFIEVEKNFYEEAEQKVGGWSGFRRFVVAKKVKESEVITSFYLKPEDGGPISNYLPGQYISVMMNIKGSPYRHIRQYSLSGAPGKDYYRISVKREPGNENQPAGIVSNELHQNVQVGDVLQLSAPAGDFVLDTSVDNPLVLISGGVGLTPLVSMAHTALQQQPEREIIFIHAAINGQYHALHNEISELAAQSDKMKYYVVYEKPSEQDRLEQHYDKEGYIDAEFLQSVLPNKEDAEYYFCGPIPFMKAVNQIIKGWVSPEQIHYEFFGPASVLEENKPAAV